MLLLESKCVFQNLLLFCFAIFNKLLAEGEVSVYYLLTESEVITGKSQTEALMY